MQSSIIQIKNILVSSEIITECFSCDYEKCGGVCCIIGDSGAPIEEDEAEQLEREYPNYKELMSEAGRHKIDETGFFEIDTDGDMVTPLLGNVEECAYTRFEDGGCFCAIERSYCAGKCAFAKPISCRLYPIRVSTLSNGLTALNLHRWPICADAFKKGKKEELPVYKFLREPLIFKFGKEFYSLLEGAAKIFNAKS
ncbi:MAG: DUF3109 family protein [Bacteroidales bacterium]|nr:DUF3109 family protein [Bacteroidales bacterium]MDD3200678.1 DUF3109 family protein [Bacteroidales bacterium]